MPCHFFIGVLEARIIESHACGQQPENLRIRFALAERVNRRLVQHRVGMAVGAMDIEMFKLRGRRQKDIRVIRGVGLEVFEDDSE